ncbi:hypothetical protein [Kribbella steppae]|uniref:hypothetical protein n=1 Tax=Kribbella steppae TaxID=2512223 RepID=UPI00104308F5|nr:hypothetical protein [Kribbella steppae]
MTAAVPMISNGTSFDLIHPKKLFPLLSRRVSGRVAFFARTASMTSSVRFALSVRVLSRSENRFMAGSFLSVWDVPICSRLR